MVILWLAKFSNMTNSLPQQLPQIYSMTNYQAPANVFRSLDMFCHLHHFRITLYLFQLLRIKMTFSWIQDETIYFLKMVSKGEQASGHYQTIKYH